MEKLSAVNLLLRSTESALLSSSIIGVGDAIARILRGRGNEPASSFNGVGDAFSSINGMELRQLLDATASY